MAFDDDDFMARFGEEVGSAHADHAATDYCYLLLCHLFNPLLRMCMDEYG